MPEKREPAQDGSDMTKKRARRQDPVSCQTCRAKKLKCNREIPCSNCQARRVECEYSHDTNRAIGSSVGDYTPVHAPPAISKRAANTTGPDQAEQRLRESSEHEQTADWLETIMMGPRIPDVMPASLKDRLIPREMASLVDLTVFLPREPEAMAMLDHYVECMDYVYHVIIPSRTKAQFENVYHSVQKQSAVDLGYLALLFSIAAASHYFQGIESTQPSKEAEKRSGEYSALVGAALTQAKYMLYPTIEGLQATIIISHCVSNVGQDPSIRPYFVHATIIAQAMQMHLHQTDTARSKAFRKRSRYDPVDVELKRRLWWQLVSYDWLLGFLSGPQESTYFIHPSQMSVNMPANIREEDIEQIEQGAVLPPDQFTTKMSYALERIKLAIVCRRIVDETGPEHLQGTEIEYSKIIELDRALDQVYQQIPNFFRLDSGNRRKYAQLYKDYPQVSWQRLLLQQAFNSRICRLHRYHFIRGARDPAYSYSHVRCLQSARRVIEIKRIMDDEAGGMPGGSLVWFVMHHVFMSAVFLMMDMCVNWDDILAEKRREEVMDACRMLDKAQQRSGIVREGVNAMMDVLQRYWRPSDTQEQTKPGTTEAVSQSDAQIFADQMGVSGSGNDLCLENTWSELLDSSAPMAANAEDWMSLFTDLSDVAALVD